MAGHRSTTIRLDQSTEGGAPTQIPITSCLILLTLTTIFLQGAN